MSEQNYAPLAMRTLVAVGALVAFSLAGLGLNTQSPRTGTSAVLPRIGVLQDGNLRVKEGELGAEWVLEKGNVRSFQLYGTRIGVLLTGGALLVKEGAINAEWVTEMGDRSSEKGDVSSFQLDGDRIGVLLHDGSLKVKEGPLDAEWVLEKGNVRSFQLDGTRIGVLLTGGALLVKEGAINAEWVTEMGDRSSERGDVSSFRLGSDQPGLSNQGISAAGATGPAVVGGSGGGGGGGQGSGKGGGSQRPEVEIIVPPLPFCNDTGRVMAIKNNTDRTITAVIHRQYNPLDPRTGDAPITVGASPGTAILGCTSEENPPSQVAFSIKSHN